MSSPINSDTAGLQFQSVEPTLDTVPNTSDSRLKEGVTALDKSPSKQGVDVGKLMNAMLKASLRGPEENAENYLRKRGF